MPSIVVEDFTGTAPLQEDGAGWPFALMAGKVVVFSDCNAELVAALYAEYALIPDDDAEAALISRVDLAVAMAEAIQAQYVQNFLESAEGAAGITEETLEILAVNKNMALSVETTWDHPVTLVGVATDYEPFRKVPAPTGNILLLDPYTEVSLLETLSVSGAVAYLVNRN